MLRIPVLVMTIVLTVGVAGCAQTRVATQPTPTATLLPREECVVLEASLANIGRGPRETPSPPEEFVSLAEAEQATLFDILLPTYLPEDVTLQCVHLLGASAAYLIYSDGLTVRGVAAGTAPRWPLKALVEEGWVEVTVAGAPGLGHEPNDVQAIGGTIHNNGSVMWWIEGVSYVVTGDLPLRELLRIAQSLE